MTYREPGAYLKVINSSRGAQFPSLPMLPLIIGTGAIKRKATISMVRGDTASDTLPYTSVNSISRIADALEGAATWAPTTDYVFVADGNTIAWETDKGPEAGDTYYVDLVYNVEDSQYEMNLCYTPDEVIAKYGPDYQEAEAGLPLNSLSLAAQLALQNGAAAVYVLQVETPAAAPLASDFITALDTYAAVTAGIWRIIPVDVTAEINTAILAHVNAMSTWEERKERTAFLSAAYTSAPATFADVLTEIGGDATAIANRRATILYPDSATYVCSDGTERTVGAGVLYGVLAGLEQAYAISKGRTRLELTGFGTLGGVKMTRTQMNQLAEDGVLILTQMNVGDPIIIRHQLTTDPTSLQTREMSLVAIQDYCSKFLRNIMEPYIGRYTINAELINMLTAALKSGMNQLVRLDIITSGEIRALYQDEDNPDTVIANLAVGVPYPCNYIDLTLYMQ